MDIYIYKPSPSRKQPRIGLANVRPRGPCRKLMISKSLSNMICAKKAARQMHHLRGSSSSPFGCSIVDEPPNACVKRTRKIAFIIRMFPMMHCTTSGNDRNSLHHG